MKKPKKILAIVAAASSVALITPISGAHDANVQLAPDLDSSVPLQMEEEEEPAQSRLRGKKDDHIKRKKAKTKSKPGSEKKKKALKKKAKKKKVAKKRTARKKTAKKKVAKKRTNKKVAKKKTKKKAAKKRTKKKATRR